MLLNEFCYISAIKGTVSPPLTERVVMVLNDAYHGDCCNKAGRAGEDMWGPCWSHTKLPVIRACGS